MIRFVGGGAKYWRQSFWRQHIRRGRDRQVVRRMGNVAEIVCDKILLTYKAPFRIVGTPKCGFLSIQIYLTGKEEHDEGPYEESKREGEVKPA
jgi:hypothetical protein